MPISGGKYVAPSWANGTAPYINASELQAISDSIALLPIANGGTGASTASTALSNLGGVPLSYVQNKGSSTRPVYFNGSGQAVAISGAIPVNYGGTGVTSRSSTSVTPKGFVTEAFIWSWGRIVMLRFVTNSISADSSVSTIIPSDYRPTAALRFAVTGDAPGVFARGSIDANGGISVDQISTSGSHVYMGLITYLI